MLCQYQCCPPVLDQQQEMTGPRNCAWMMMSKEHWRLECIENDFSVWGQLPSIYHTEKLKRLIFKKASLGLRAPMLHRCHRIFPRDAMLHILHISYLHRSSRDGEWSEYRNYSNTNIYSNTTNLRDSFPNGIPCGKIKGTPFGSRATLITKKLSENRTYAW